MSRLPSIKICGLTRARDVDDLADFGIHAIGMVFYPRSRRCVTLARAAQLRERVPAFVSTVALFVNPEEAAVRQVIQAVRPELLQFHGEETPVFCRQFGVRYLKAFRVGGPGQARAAEVAALCRRYPDAAGWLFDSYSPGYGGSGQGFPLDLLAEVPRGPDWPSFILSGGLVRDNVAQRIRACQPDAVDVSSGVESAPGVKDRDRVRDFVAAVRCAEA